MSCVPAPRTPAARTADDADALPTHLIAVACGHGAAVYGMHVDDEFDSTTSAPPVLVHLLRATPSQQLVVCSGVLFRAPKPVAGVGQKNGVSVFNEGALLAVSTVSLADTPKGDGSAPAMNVTLFQIRQNPLCVHTGGIHASSYVAHRTAGTDLVHLNEAGFVSPREDATIMCFHPDPAVNMLVVAPRLPSGRCTAIVWIGIGETVSSAFCPADVID